MSQQFYRSSDVKLPTQTVGPTLGSILTQIASYVRDILDRLAFLEETSPQGTIYATSSLDGGITNPMRVGGISGGPVSTPGGPSTTTPLASDPKPFVTYLSQGSNFTVPQMSINQTIYVNPTTTITITLPTPLSANDRLTIMNIGTHTITVHNSDGTTANTIAAGALSGYMWTPTTAGTPTPAPTPVLTALPIT